MTLVDKEESDATVAPLNLGIAIQCDSSKVF
jgi:hypothetical protein